MHHDIYFQHRESPRADGTFLFLASYSAAAHPLDLDQDFREACNVFEEAVSIGDDAKTMDRYVRETLPSRVQSQDITDAYDAILLVNADDRYYVFQEAAQSNTGAKWDCPALKVLVE